MPEPSPNPPATPASPPPETPAANAPTTPATVAGLQAQLDALTAQREADSAALKAATEKYRLAVQQGASDLPGTLITGDSIEQIEGTLAAARAIADQVRAHDAEAAKQRALGFQVPAGSSVRGAPDTGAMSAREKIKHALTQP